MITLKLRNLTFWLLCGFVFSLPWELFVTIRSIGTASRLIGIMALAVGVLTIAARGQIRRPSLVVFLAFTFVLANVLSLFWTISFGESITRVLTYVQLFGLIWITWETVRDNREAEALLIAYCLGAYVSIADSLARFSSGEIWRAGAERFSGGNMNPNEFGAYLALGIPIAWFLFLRRQGFVRILSAAYLPLATVALLLTGSRGAFLAGVCALSVVPLTASRRSLRSWAIAVVILMLSIGAVAPMVPQSIWDRVLTTGEQISAGTFGGRGTIWAAGFEVLQDRPLFGFGSGAFAAAVEPLLGPGEAPHNAFLAIAVEQGLIGLSIFIALICATGRLILRLGHPLRSTWAVVMLVWLIGSMSINWQYGKVTWWLLAMIAVHGAAYRERIAQVDGTNRSLPSRASVAHARQGVA